MNEFVIREASVADAPALAELANQYTYQNLDEHARQGGFLTGSFAAPALGAMLASVPGQVAYYQEELAASLSILSCRPSATRLLFKPSMSCCLA